MLDLLFLRGFLTNWREVGSPLPCSRHVARKVCSLIDFTKVRSMVEVGPGTGAITREILAALRPDATLTVFEVNPTFCAALKSIADPRLIVHNQSAFDMPSYIKKQHADCIVSGIPIAMLSNDDFSRFHDAVRNTLQAGGLFLQAQLAPLSYLRLRRSFRQVRMTFTLRNALPIFLYYCRYAALQRRSSETALAETSPR